LAWFQEKLPSIATGTGVFLQKSIGGVFGVLGFLLSLILVPVFLFFFLLESPAMSDNWSRYLPLRASPLKEEIVSLFNEINDYLIHFFRGQLLVSLIDGAIVGLSLFVFLRLDFSFLIGLLVGVLCLIPYFGFIVCLIPAMLIALAQYGDLASPLYVLLIFTATNWLEGIFISPQDRRQFGGTPSHDGHPLRDGLDHRSGRPSWGTARSPPHRDDEGFAPPLLLGSPSKPSSRATDTQDRGDD
jgi:predicted PurR-regulated permease PerM